MNLSTDLSKMRFGSPALRGAIQQLIDVARQESATAAYLRAKGTLACYKLEWPEGSGVYVRPSELPAEYLEKCRQAEWKLLRKAETL